MQMKNTCKCHKCELSIIETEQHECHLENVKYVGYVLINNKWYINWIMTEEKKSKHIQPIPIPSYILNPADESLQSDKDRENRRRLDKTLF